MVILLDVLSIVSSSKEQKKQEHLDRQSSSIIHFSDLLGTAQGITCRPRIVGLGFFLSLLAWVLFQGLLICIAGRRSFQGGFAHGLFEKPFLSSPALQHPLNFCKKMDSWRLQIHLNSCMQGRFDVKYLEATTPRSTTEVHLRLAWRRRDVRVLRLHATSLRYRGERGTKCSEVWFCRFALTFLTGRDLQTRRLNLHDMLSSFQEYIPRIVDFPSQL